MAHDRSQTVLFSALNCSTFSSARQPFRLPEISASLSVLRALIPRRLETSRSEIGLFSSLVTNF